MAQPLVWLGAYSSGGLALPAAQPTASQLYAPRGVFFNDDMLVVADSGNHRILIWHGLPTQDRQAADVVLGQPDFMSEGPAAGGRGAANGLYLPTGVMLIHGRLFVADAWHHRILVWEHVPESSFQPPDAVLGQESFTAVEPNRGGPPDASSFYWPYGIGYINEQLYVTDTGNRRVLGWHGMPEQGQSATILLGQTNMHLREENRGGAADAHSFRWPHAVAGDEHMLFVADAGNHRVLGWQNQPQQSRPADIVLGQHDFQSTQEWPYVAPGPSSLRFPYCLAFDHGRLAVADTANNRVLFWHTAAQQGCFQPADAVIGQPDFSSNGENGWRLVTHETLCWPYGIHLHGDKLAIADSGNNRVMIWKLG